MIADLTSLEQKLDQFMLNYQTLRSENQELRTRVAALESDKRRLEDTLDTARVRLEALMSRLPVQAE